MDIYVSPLPAMTEYLMQRRSAWQVARAKVSTFLQGEISLRKDMRNMVPVESHSTPATPATSNDTGETVDDSADCIISMVLAQGGGGEKMTDKEIEDELLGLLL
jgi:cytochrome P450